MENFQELSKKELFSIEGGSMLSDAICWLAGAMFACPGWMAMNGAAGHEVMGFK